MEKILLALDAVSKAYPLGGRAKNQVLHDISLPIYQGETLGLVGESGSGKSTLARLIMGMERPDSGTVLYEGAPVFSRRRSGRLAYARKAQIIFQDSLASLDPQMTVGAILSEGLEIHKLLDKAGRKQRVAQLLELVGLEPGHAGRYPHEFSGGQRQRIGIARALAVNPAFLLCDEPVSALDVSVQGHIINLLRELQERLGLTSLFISHDLNLVHTISHRIAVLYAGHLVELGGSGIVCLRPQHPYTQFLLESVLLPDPDRRVLQKIRTRPCEAVGSATPTDGCVFAPLCPLAQGICQQTPPDLREVMPGHFAACHFAG